MLDWNVAMEQAEFIAVVCRKTMRNHVVPINAFVLFHNVSSHELQISCMCTKFITKKHTQKHRNNIKFYLFYRNLRSKLKGVLVQTERENSRDKN